VSSEGGPRTPVPSSPSATTTSSSPSAVTTPRPAASSYYGGKNISWRNGAGKCLTVGGTPSTVADGASVSLQSCGGAGTVARAMQEFQPTPNGGFRLGGTGYCLDARSYPSNGGQLKIWKCYPGSLQQTFKDIGNGLIQTSYSKWFRIRVKP
jgi:hypothetical protein